ncbi:MAG: saccharopine dehydrogenase NADP-binding domain-containing protein [Deltaproteobacteria bacterium]|nr:saccharopine dehydrogenase NADP-binding domain-containing protein [Deltaproteobacteria bacterium]
MARRAIVLGCGMVGRTIAADLAADGGLEVAACDRDPARLEGLDPERIRPIRAEIGPGRVGELVRPFDVVAGALASAVGFEVLRAVLQAGKPICDISFMAEDALQLDALAREQGVTAVVDCGVAPGMANMAIGMCDADFDSLEDVCYFVGGLPRIRRWPYEYKAPFAPSDVIEEYTREARMRIGGRQVAKPALSEPELVHFEGLGTLEAFNTDGLRSLLTSVDAPNMKEKTLRYPGHAALMRALVDTGLLSDEPVEIDGLSVRPRALTSKLLFEQWALQPGEPEFTVLRVVCRGLRAGRAERYVFELFDQTDERTGQTSMARTTGFPCAAVCRMLAAGEIDAPGVLPPEALGRRPGVFARICDELRTRGVQIRSDYH